MCFGIDSTVSCVRRSPATYAVCVLRPFVKGVDPTNKLVRREGTDWCSDALDVLVVVNQPVVHGEMAIRKYVPAVAVSPAGGQRPTAVFDLYRSDKADARYTTDPGVVKCGTLLLDLNEDVDGKQAARTNVIQVRTTFSGTNIRVTATNNAGRAAVVQVSLLSK